VVRLEVIGNLLEDVCITQVFCVTDQLQRRNGGRHGLRFACEDIYPCYILCGEILGQSYNSNPRILARLIKLPSFTRIYQTIGWLASLTLAIGPLVPLLGNRTVLQSCKRRKGIGKLRNMIYPTTTGIRVTPARFAYTEEAVSGHIIPFHSRNLFACSFPSSV